MEDPPSVIAAAAEPPTDAGPPTYRRKWHPGLYEELSLIFQLLTLLAIVLYTWFSYKQSSIMELQLHAMAGRLAITGFQPYPLTVGKMGKISFNVENPRPTPARIVAIRMTILTRPAAESPPEIDTLTVPTESSGGTVVHSLYINAEPQLTLTENDLQLIRADTVRLYFVGKLEYEDGFGRWLPLPFCKVYLVGSEWQDCSIPIPASR